MNTLYTVQRCRKNENAYGPLHGADNDQNTVCGKDIDHNWFIINNTFDGEINCKECLKILKDKPAISQRLKERK